MGASTSGKQLTLFPSTKYFLRGQSLRISLKKKRINIFERHAKHFDRLYISNSETIYANK